MSEQDIIEICNKYGIVDFTIGYDIDGLYVDVDGDVRLFYNNLEELPMRFGMVSGNFNCNSNRLISLVGSPRVVGGDFNCNGNGLTSLEFSPISVGGDFNCVNNELTSLVGCPLPQGNGVVCFSNPLDNTSLYHLFDLGYDLGNIISDRNLFSLKRQWVIKGIINE
jgi:hypothetical protein